MRGTPATPTCSTSVEGRAGLTVAAGAARSMNSDVSTHNAEQLAEHKGTAYGAAQPPRAITTEMAARLRSAVSARDGLIRQLDELRATQRTTADQAIKFEAELSGMRALNSRLTTDLGKAQAQVQSLLETQREQCRSTSSTGSEVEMLREQVRHWRHSLINQEDSSSIQAMTERGEQTASMYEEVILSLREETTRLTCLLHEANGQRDEAVLRCERFRELEGELQMQKEFAALAAKDRAATALLSAEASERAARVSQERQQLQAEVHRLESAVSNAQSELQHARDDLAAEVKHSRESQIGKLEAERRASEAQSEQARIELEWDEWKQSHAHNAFETQRAIDAAAEHSATAAQLRVKLQDVEHADAQKTRRLAELERQLGEVCVREEDARIELQLCLQQRATMQIDLDSARQSLAAQRSAFDMTLRETQALRTEVEALRSELEFCRKDAAMLETSRVEAQLQSLRGELSQTVEDWKRAEFEKKDKSKLICSLQGDLIREREKNNVLKSEVSFLTDKLAQSRAQNHEAGDGAKWGTQSFSSSRVASPPQPSVPRARQQSPQRSAQSPPPRAAPYTPTRLSPQRVSVPTSGGTSGKPLSLADFVAPSASSSSYNSAPRGRTQASEEAQAARDALRRRREVRALQRERERAAAALSSSTGATRIFQAGDFDKAKSLLGLS